MNNTEHPLLLYLFENSPSMYGFHIQRAIPISLGWLNLKWRLETDVGDFVLKLYHANRYSHEEFLQRALAHQQMLYRSGLPCPELIEKNGDLLHHWGNEKYMIMRFVPGQVVKTDLIRQEQMYDLGRVTGRMHRLWNHPNQHGKLTPQFIPQTKEERRSHWYQMLGKAQQKKEDELIHQIELQLKATEIIDIQDFGSCITGWTHRDLWSDNVLFLGGEVSAILDFDRSSWDYPELDVARAVMSWAFDKGHFRNEFAAAFLEGYRTEAAFPHGAIIRSLRMLWYLESIWWIHDKHAERNAVTQRFAKEMNWLASHMNEISELCGDI
ncbi:phosphotransferase [Marinicrinis lubricantis]|uniref:Phosphotransferase n=1 Tax=Marinicrinis lubricantis TaxID=2086470 RepID=A0ABW1IQ17_9BACL